MKISNVSKISLKREYVLIEVNKVLDTSDGIYLGSVLEDANDIKMYTGVVRAIGPKVKELKVNQTVIFQQFAGYHVAIQDKGLFKVMDENSILGIIDETDEINDGSVTPTDDRVFVKVKASLEDENGIILTGKAAQDPRLIDLSYATVIKTGQNVTDTVIGDVVAYEPYCGEKIRPNISSNQPELKLLREADILLNVNITTEPREL